MEHAICEGMTVISPESPPFNHQLVQVRLDSGRSQAVDFGKTSLSELDLDNGDKVVIEGRMGTEHGRQILVAERVYVDGGRHDLR